jgi:xeroderma pigmentosum group C-complementing protein
MLPIGCVHLRLPGIAALCRRLGIDFAPALTGFDVRGCFSVPSYDGVVVCQEYAPALRLAWEEQEARLHEKLYYKQRKHIVQLWQRLARSLLMHQHVQQTYVTQSPISTSPQILKKQLSVVNDTVHVHHFEELFLSDQKQWIKYCTCGFQITFERI